MVSGFLLRARPLSSTYYFLRHDYLHHGDTRVDTSSGLDQLYVAQELTHRRKKENEIDRMHKDLNTIEQHLKYCKRASAMATLLAACPAQRGLIFE